MFEIRLARLSDLPFVRSLTLDSLEYGIPEGRAISAAQVRENAVSQLDDLETVIDSQDVALLIALDKDTPVGFLLLELDHVMASTGERQSFIVNLAVRPEYWGRYAGHALVREAARLTAQRGLRYMSSSVTASNRRSVVSALRAGFKIESYQMTVACNADGIDALDARAPVADRLWSFVGAGVDPKADVSERHDDYLSGLAD
jgi:ribosomal protein S18 acetylase RimI-like enzyme